MCPTLKEHPFTGRARGTQCPLLLSLLCCVASSPVDTVGSWEPLETALDSCALSAHVRTFSHQGGVMVKVFTLLRLIGCWVIIAVDSWWKLNSHFGGDDGLEQLVTYLKNCVRKACKQSCIALYKFKKQRLYFKPHCNQKRRTVFFLRSVRPIQAIKISSSCTLLRDFIKTIGTIEWLVTEWFG